MRKTKYIGIAIAALMLVSGKIPGFSSGIFSADNNAVSVSAAYINSGTVGNKFSYCLDPGTYQSYLYLSVIDENNKTAAVVGCGLGMENTSVQIPQSATFHGVKYTITEIAANAFEGQTNLSSIKMSNVKKIGDRAFYNCTSLTEFSFIYEPVETIGNEAFYNCSVLSDTSLYYVSKIGYRAFGNCNSLTSLTLPYLSTLGSNAFEDCWNLTNVRLDESKLKNIPSYTFKNCGMLKQLFLPDNLETIGDYAFENCRMLQQLSFPENMKIIGSYAFERCGLQTIYIPESVKNISSCAFRYCRSLKTAMIPENIETIGDYAFYGCDVMNYFVCKNPNARIGIQAVGYDYNRFRSGPKKDFVIWGKGGDIKNYAVNNGFTYKDCSQAPAEAKQKFKDYQWSTPNRINQWVDDTGSHYFIIDSHRKYVSKYYQEKTSGGSCYGMAVVSVMTYNGYIKADDFCPGYSTIRSIPKNQVPSMTKSFVNTIFSQQKDNTYDYSITLSNFSKKEMLKYAEYITYGADAAICIIPSTQSDHSIVCYGLEFKEDASDKDTNEQWKNMDARILVYDPDGVDTPMEDCYYVNFLTGEWGNGRTVDKNYKYKDFEYSNKNNPNFYFKMIYNPDHMIKYNDGTQDITGVNLMYEILNAGKNATY